MKWLRVGPSLAVGDLELAPVEMTLVRGDCSDGWLMATAAKEPVAIVIRSRHRSWALDLEGREIPLTDLAPGIEGL